MLQIMRKYKNWYI